MTAQQTAELIRTAVREAGFELSGLAPVGELPELKHLSPWLEAGYAGEMKYMEARDQAGEFKRASLKGTFPWARSVVVCAVNYNTAHPRSTDLHDPSRGWISRYAWSHQDYHEVVLRKLRAVEQKLIAAVEGVQTRCYVDTGPLVERVYAKYAGVGWIGKNTCIISQKLGSWLFLGVILTSLELTPDIPAPDRCGTCTRCIDACPTDAFVGPYVLDSNRCISYLTIEKRGEIPEHLREGMGRHMFGCDICQDVCPWNRKAPITTEPGFQPRESLVNPALEWLAQISDDEFRRVFRDSPVRRTKRNGLRRNAVIAMGNSGNQAVLPMLEKLEADPDEVVAKAAIWAAKQLKGPC